MGELVEPCRENAQSRLKVQPNIVTVILSPDINPSFLIVEAFFEEKGSFNL